MVHFLKFVPLRGGVLNDDGLLKVRLPYYSIFIKHYNFVKIFFIYTCALPRDDENHASEPGPHHCGTSPCAKTKKMLSCSGRILEEDQMTSFLRWFFSLHLRLGLINVARGGWLYVTANKSQALCR